MEKPESGKSELQREFELERVILFSDAVFAIAITLLVLDIKYPDNLTHEGKLNWIEIFHPLLMPFFSFLISFIFIGSQWARHIEHMRYVRQYDRWLIILNLVFLFFVVLFPFSASFLGKTTPDQQLPYFIIYISNVLLCVTSLYAIAVYLFRMKTSLCFDGNEEKKKQLLQRDLATVFSICILGAAIIGMNLIPKSNPLRIGLLVAAVIVIRLIFLRVRRMQKKSSA